MAERLYLVLREEGGPQPNPPDLVRELREQINNVLKQAAPHSLPPDVVGVRPDEKESKARQIPSSVMEKLAALEAERESLLKERDEAAKLKHKERMFELKIERFNAIVKALEVLTSKGIRLTAGTTMKIELALADISEPAGP